MSEEQKEEFEIELLKLLYKVHQLGKEFNTRISIAHVGGSINSWCDCDLIGKTELMIWDTKTGIQFTRGISKPIQKSITDKVLSFYKNQKEAV